MLAGGLAGCPTQLLQGMQRLARRQTKELAANLAVSERRHGVGVTFWNVENRVLAGKATYGGYRGEKSQEGY